MEKGEERINYAVPRLKQLTRLWMNGRPLRELEIALGVEPTKLKTCDGARKFIMRIVPSLAYAFSLPALLKQHAASPDGSEAGVVPPQLAELAHCVRHGFDTHEKAALNQHLRNERLSRVLVHERFSAIQPHLTAAPLEETWADTLARVEAAILQIGKQ